MYFKHRHRHVLARKLQEYKHINKIFSKLSVGNNIYVKFCSLLIDSLFSCVLLQQVSKNRNGKESTCNAGDLFLPDLPHWHVDHSLLFESPGKPTVLTMNLLSTCL